MRTVLAMPLLLLLLAGADECQAPKPDLVVAAFTVDPQGYLLVELRNDGLVDVPTPLAGRLTIAVDGVVAATRTFASLPAEERGFVTASGSGVIRTGVRLGGRRRDVAVMIDPAGEIAEENELNNLGSRAVDAPALTGPDFSVLDLSVAGPDLRVLIYNRGNAASPAGRVVALQVDVDDAWDTVFVTLPSLPAFGLYYATVAPPLPLTGSRRVTARVITLSTLHELDATNNQRTEHLPSLADLAPFNALLSDPRIADAMVWSDASGTFAYPRWPTSMRLALSDALRALLDDRPYELSTPPPLDASGTMTQASASRIYLASVAQSLWLEATGRVPWSLTTLTDEGRALLLDSRRIVPAVGARHRFAGRAASPRPLYAYRFLESAGLVRATQLDTIEAVIDWARTHVFHGDASTSPLDLYGYDGPPLLERVLWPLPGKAHISLHGCWSSTALLQAALRAVNIPVAPEETRFDGHRHSSPDFVSVARRMPHGDDLYNSTDQPSGGALPSRGRDLLYTPGRFASLFVTPTPECVGADCNTVYEQIGINHLREQLRRSYDWRLDYLAYVWATAGRASVDEALAIQSTWAATYVRPAFSPSERASMLTSLETYITDSLGGGDLANGLDRARVRWTRYQSAKRVR